MLDHVCVVTFGGLVRWQKSYSQLVLSSKSHPIDAAIREALIEQRTLNAPSSTSKTSEIADGVVVGQFKVKWILAKEYSLVFLVVYQKILLLSYIDGLLEEFKEFFCSKFEKELKNDELILADDFEEVFDSLLRDTEERDAEEKKRRGPRKFQESQKIPNTLEATTSQQTTSPSVFGEDSVSPSSSPDVRNSPRSRPGRKPQSKQSKPVSDTSTRAKRGPRKWVGGIATEGSESLDYSDATDPSEAAISEHLKVSGTMELISTDGLYDAPEMESRSNAKSKTTSNPNSVVSFLSSYLTGKQLTSDDLEPIVSKLREQLIAKNVAADIASHVCTSLQSSLIGTKTKSFESVTSVVKRELEIALKRILTPRTSIEVLRDVVRSRDAGEVYSFVFVGVNGVGKSTNLSKIAYLLLRNGLSVLIAACDTFRAGAVEQLRVHARNLKASVDGARVELFERGYGSDAAGIAKEALKFASLNKFNVVLIDTAGRMQDNEPLMRALAKLVSVNNPDKILFVGEALVGNEAVDQLVKFNQALKDFSGIQIPRQIDGIILTKFDTIDDKVGAALSMTYITKQPILFTGVGQTYEDIRRLNVSDIVEKLID
ncbi:hypothetical protein HK096_004126 [Nowakowskiella sp. JEL0078]|nr:hypothetical protein HK096_004126 [Nowakowskiella sp. JEL0078]